MFPENITIAINNVDRVLTRINQDGYSSEYRLRDDTNDFSMRIRHSSYVRKGTSVRVDRHNVELIQTKFATDVEREITRKAYVVFENEHGDSTTGTLEFVSGWKATMLSNANIEKMIQWES